MITTNFGTDVAVTDGPDLLSAVEIRQPSPKVEQWATWLRAIVVPRSTIATQEEFVRDRSERAGPQNAQRHRTAQRKGPGILILAHVDESGSLEGSYLAELSRRLEMAIVRSRERDILIDCSNVVTVTPAFFGVCRRVREQLAERGQALLIINGTRVAIRPDDSLVDL